MQVGKNLNVNSDIYQILDRLFIDCTGTGYFQHGYKEASDYLMVQCPYHKFGRENTPSAQFKKDDGLFYCHKCKISHSLPKVISDVLKLNGYAWLKENFETVEDAVFDATKFKLKVDKPEVEKPIYINPEALKKYQGYSDYMLKVRGISKEVLDFFDVGYDKERNCVTFPNKDKWGNILFVATRSIDTKFFHYPEGIDKPLYGLYELEKARKAGRVIDKVFVVESMIDALSIWTWGGFAVAMNGTGTHKQYEQIADIDCPLIVLATDNDKAGRDAREKFFENVKGKFIKEIDYDSYEDCKDINDFSEEQWRRIKIISHFLEKRDKVTIMAERFDKEIPLALSRAKVVTVDSESISKIFRFVDDLIIAKQEEAQHQLDGRKEFKRFSTGLLGERAVEMLIKKEIIDWTIGESSIYAVPDIPNYNIGVKAAEYGKYPIIAKNNKSAQIICVTDPKEYGKVYVLGLATPEVLNEYQDDDLILDENLRKKRTKTGFYGFDHLKPITPKNFSHYKQGE